MSEGSASSQESLYYLPADRITFADVRRFVQQSPQEGPTHEFKREWTRRICESVAAFGNTYGGLVLVGVEESDDEPTAIIGVPPETELRITNACHELLQPPFVPQIVSVAVPETDRLVLVLRIDPAIVPRPIVMQGRIPYRFGSRNAPADRLRMEQLFAENRLQELGAALVPVHPPFDWSNVQGPPSPDLVVQISVTIPITRWQSEGLVIGQEQRSRLQSNLSRSPVSEWLETQASRWQLQTTGWEQHGVNRSSRSSYAASAHLPDGQLGIEVQGISEIQQQAAVASVAAIFMNRNIENWARQERGESSPRGGELLTHASLGLEELYTLLKTALATAVDRMAVETLFKMVDPSPWRPVPPAGRLTSPANRMLKTILRLEPSPAVPLNTNSGADLDAHGETWPRSADERTATVIAWIRKLLFDLGLSDADARLDTLYANGLA